MLLLKFFLRRLWAFELLLGRRRAAFGARVVVDLGFDAKMSENVSVVVFGLGLGLGVAQAEGWVRR